jgi:O-antigen/teichoic acid export membrane protein
VTGIIRRVGLYGIATVLPSAITFLFLPVLTRQMSKNEFGTMSALTALFNLFFIAFTLYLDRSLGRLYYLYEGEARRELIGSLFLSVLGISSAGVLISIGLSPFFETIYPQISAWRFGAYAVSMYFTVLVYFARMYYTAAEKPTQYLFLSLSVSAATVFGMYWFIIVRQGGVDGWIKALIFANAVVALPAGISIARISSLRLRPVLVKEALLYAGPMIPAFFFTWLSGSADRLLVGHWAGMNNNALYGAATQLSNILPVVFLPVYMTYTPIFYRFSSGTEEDRKIAQALNRALMLLIVTVACALIVSAPWLAGTVLPASYRGVSGTFAWLVVAGCLMQCAGLGQTALYFDKRTDLVLIVTAVTAGAAVVADLAMIPRMGREGAVIGQLISSAVMASGMFLLAWRRYPDFIQRKFATRVFATIALMGVVAEAQTRLGHLGLWLTVEAGILAGLGIQIWTERTAFSWLRSKDLWKAPEMEPVVS